MAAFDAAGNQLCDSDSFGAVRQYAFDGENRIGYISTLANVPFESYAYGGDGARVFKQDASGHYTEYMDFNGQPIAELDETNAWTYYVYANGKKVAHVLPSYHTMHTHGERDGLIDLACGTNYDVSGAGGAGHIIHDGDRVTFDQKAISAQGGISFLISLPNGTQAQYVRVNADDGMSIYQDTSPDGMWHTRTADLTGGGVYTGFVIVQPVVTAQNTTPPGTWDQWLANVSITGTDGTVTPVLTEHSLTGRIWSACGASNPSFATEQDTPGPDGPAMAIHFFVGDHLGSAQMEFSASGTPLSMSQFMPFGAEINPPVTANHYKFTGKERDAESGLDYFGARYYASNMGRWMSPDWADKPEAVPYSSLSNPQSLNLYGYVLNNPISGVDADGHWPQVARFIFEHPGQALSNLKQNLGSAGMALAKVAVNTINLIGGDCSCQAAVQRNTPTLAPSNAMEGATMMVAPLVLPGMSIAVSAAASAPLEVESASQMTTLFRAVDATEMESITNTGTFSPSPNGTEYKGFFNSAEGAQQFGAQQSAMGGPTTRVMSGTAPTD